MKWKEWLYRSISVKPVIGKVVYQIRYQIEQINHYSEFDIRVKTINMFLLSVTIYALALLIFILFSSGFLLTFVYSICSLFLAASVQGIMIERLKYQLLKQQIHLNDQIRHSYYEYKSVIDAVMEAAHTMDEVNNYEIMIQVHKIIEALNHKEIETSTLEYSERAPNKYLKLLMNIIYITYEYGDTILEGGASLFLRSLATLNMEVRTELIKRERINFLLKGLNFIIVIPLLMMQPIKSWASWNFTPLKEFYNGYIGKFIEVAIIGVVFLCFYLLSKLQKTDSYYRANTKQSFLEELIQFPFLAKVEHYLQPKRGSLKYKEIIKRLKAILSPLSIEEYVHRKLLSSIITGLVLVAVNVGIVQNVRKDYIVENIWWTHIAFLGVGLVLGWMVQDLLLIYQENLMKLEVEEEISQLQIILLNLIHIKQINVYEILEWMELFTVHLKNPIQKCIVCFDCGTRDALEELKSSLEHPGFKQIINNLILATTDLSIIEAFDDLENEKSFYAENRRLSNEKIIQRKQWLGQTIGFMPIYILIIGFLTIPMILSSLSQMQVEFNQLSNIK